MVRKLILLGSFTLCAASAPAQTILNYTESTNSATEIALGYPVPMPVDSLTAIAGFRSYDSLLARHTDLAMTNNEVTQVQVGTTLLGRPIFAYVISDADDLTNEGLAEPAFLVNGTIHAREWASPEVTTELIEQLVEGKADSSIIQYLIENTKIIVLPVLNIDGFLQTQRYPDQVTPTPPGVVTSTVPPEFEQPRDGRMRRKNLRDTDEDLATDADRLLGVDLNRNNLHLFDHPNAFNSTDPESLIYKGPTPASEPEIQALQAAAALGPESQLRFYVDAHSFSRILIMPQSTNTRLDAINVSLAGIVSASTTTMGQPAYFPVTSVNPPTPTTGATSTTAAFMVIEHQIPGWTLEIEPPRGFPGLPSGGAYYGGNGISHDGFILPDSQIARTRDENALSMIIGMFRMAGPPILQSVRVVSPTGTTVYSADWTLNATTGVRTLTSSQNANLAPGATYTMWVNFDKPMRYTGVNGSAIEYPGQGAFGLTTVSPRVVSNAFTLAPAFVNSSWRFQPGGVPNGYQRYINDSIGISFTMPATIPATTTTAAINVQLADMGSMLLDSNPATPVDFVGGFWTGYENTAGVAGDTGGLEANHTLQVTPSPGGGGGGGGGGGALGGLGLLALLLATRRRQKQQQ